MPKMSTSLSSREGFPEDQIESKMRLSLANLLSDAVTELQVFYGAGSTLPMDQLMLWIEKYPAQLVTLAVQVACPRSQGFPRSQAVARGPSANSHPGSRSPCRHRTAGAKPGNAAEMRASHHGARPPERWCLTPRALPDFTRCAFISTVRRKNLLERLAIKVADASFPYGWEYLGVPDRLVQTPLTDRVYLTLTQALDNQLGRAPFGTGGTAICRIFVGLCQVGAWGCFDKFNRLEERILSAVSQQVQSIQQGLASLVKNPNTEIELVGKNLKINKNIGSSSF
ncbi:hypothetical protein B0H14DRAFT_3560749 [Mycena olivaceomarginata]|nr:hypothetical protein B0H14DRAFT_3560749 [Mycena olivaceomarginata]